MGFKEAFRRNTIPKDDAPNVRLHLKNPHWSHKKEAIGLGVATAGEAVASVMDKLPGDADIKVIGVTAGLSALAYAKRKLEVWDVQMTDRNITFHRAPSPVHSYNPKTYPIADITSSHTDSTFVQRLINTGKVIFNTPSEGDLMVIDHVPHPDNVMSHYKDAQRKIEERTGNTLSKPTPMDAWAAVELAKDGHVSPDLAEYVVEQLNQQYEVIKNEDQEPSSSDPTSPKTMGGRVRETTDRLDEMSSNGDYKPNAKLDDVFPPRREESNGEDYGAWSSDSTEQEGPRTPEDDTTTEEMPVVTDPENQGGTVTVQGFTVRPSTDEEIDNPRKRPRRHR